MGNSFIDRVEAVTKAGITGNNELFIEREVMNNSMYEGFPVVVKRDNTLYMMYVSQVDHVTVSTDLCYVKSTDGGLTWSSKILIASQNNNGFSFGVTITGRLIAMVSAGGTDTTKIYSTGINDETWTLVQTLTPPTGDWVNFGKIKELPSGRLLSCFYRYDASNHKTGLLSSTNDGQTWAYYSDISTNLNENSFEIISGTNDSNTVLVCIARVSNNDNAKNKVYKSANGGVSWSYVADVPFTKTIAYGFPAEILKDGSTLYVCFGSRFSNLMYLSYWSFDISNYESVGNWGTEKTLRYAEANIKGAYNDWGYPSLYKWGNEIYTAVYDNNPSALAEATTNETRIIISRISNRMEGVFTRSVVNSYSTIEYSKIGLIPVIDSAGIYQDIGGVNFLIIPKDGIYMAKVKATFSDSNVLGTFRKVGLALVNVGFPVDASTEFPENPINNQPAPQAIEYIHSMINTPSALLTLRTFEFTAVFNAKKGYELLLYSKHNDIVSTIQVSDVELKLNIINN